MRSSRDRSFARSAAAAASAITRSSRAATRSTATAVARAQDRSRRRLRAVATDGTPRTASARTDRGTYRARVLADAAGEHERVEPRKARRGGGDSFGGAAHEDVDRQSRSIVAAARRPRAACARRRSYRTLRAGPTRAPGPRRARQRDRPCCAHRVDSTPGSTDPERVPMARPSSGVKPIDVATEAPPRTAVTEQPLPRWATTSDSESAERVEQLGGALHGPCDRQSVEAEAANAPIGVPAPGQGIDVCVSRQCRVERGVEDRDCTARRAAAPSGRGSSRPRPGYAAARARTARRARPGQRRRRATGSRKRVPPWTTRCAAASNAGVRQAVQRLLQRRASVGRPCRIGAPIGLRARQRLARANVDHADLERAGARVDDEDRGVTRWLSRARSSPRSPAGPRPPRGRMPRRSVARRPSPGAAPPPARRDPARGR